MYAVRISTNAIRLAEEASSCYFADTNSGDDGTASVKIILFYKYLELAQVGPVIDGDLVVQGVVLEPGLGPCFCKVDFALDHEESMTESVLTVAPWQMMYTSAGTGEESGAGGDFAVPISLGQDYRDGSVRVRVYVDRRGNVPYLDADSQYDMSTPDSSFICAVDFTTRASSGAGVADKEGLDVLVSAGGDVDGQGEGLDGTMAASDFPESPTGAGGFGEGAEGEGFAAGRGPEEDGGIGMDGEEGVVAAAAAAVDGGGGFVVHASQETAAAAMIVNAIKVAHDYDEVAALRADGFEVCCTLLGNDGAIGTSLFGLALDWMIGVARE